MSKVFVIDTDKQPLDPVHPAQARQLLRNKKAAVYKHFPFTIILKESRPSSPVSPLQLKIDPGAKHTGSAIEHIHPRVKGGSNAIANLTLSCKEYNKKKGIKELKDFFKKDPARLEKILKQVLLPLADAAKNGLIQGISHKTCISVQKKDGYSYVA